jgi:hypothetical protein
MSDDWEAVCSNTWRLDLEDGYLYRVSDDRTQTAHVPSTTINQSLYDLAETLGEIKTLFEEATFEVNNRAGIRAIRNCDIGGTNDEG